MSNSSRIEAATRSHVGAVLTAAQISELVKLSDPTSTKGVYPSDCAYKRDEAGKLVPRGKTAYGDGVLEYIGENNFKVLPTEEIVRRKVSAKAAEPSSIQQQRSSRPQLRRNLLKRRRARRKARSHRLAAYPARPSR